MSQRSQILAALKQAGHDIHRRLIWDGQRHYAEYWIPERAGA